MRAAAAGCACDSVSCVEEENLVEEELTLVTAEGITPSSTRLRKQNTWHLVRFMTMLGANKAPTRAEGDTAIADVLRVIRNGALRVKYENTWRRI